MPEEDIKEWFATYNWWTIDGEVRYGKHFFKRSGIHFPLFQQMFLDFYFPSCSVQWFSGIDSIPGSPDEHVSSESIRNFHYSGCGYFVHSWAPNPHLMSQFGSVTFSLRTLFISCRGYFSFLWATTWDGIKLTFWPPSCRHNGTKNEASMEKSRAKIWGETRFWWHFKALDQIFFQLDYLWLSSHDWLHSFFCLSQHELDFLSFATEP